MGELDYNDYMEIKELKAEIAELKAHIELLIHELVNACESPPNLSRIEKAIKNILTEQGDK